MNAIEIRNLTKNFGDKQALNGLNMTVPVGAIYGFIGENGSGKSTTEKIVCGLMRSSGGEVKLFGKPSNDASVRAKLGVLIESPGCFPSCSVWDNLALQAANLGIQDPDREIRRVLKLVRMEGAAGNKYKNCSLGMKQRVGIAMALIGAPALLVLDEPINGLDADGVRIVREVLIELSQKGCTVLISSHILGELEKIATHYGIVRGGKTVREMTARELDEECPRFVAVATDNNLEARRVLRERYARVEEDEKGYLRVYDGKNAEAVVAYLCERGVWIREVKTAKISLEEYYIDLMKEGNRGI